MTRINFILELEELNKHFIHYGHLLAKSMEMTMRAVDLLDKDVAREVIEGDDEFDHLERQITRDCIQLIVKQQPIAKDVRNVVAVMRAGKEIEKMADHCESICQYIIMLCKEKEIETPDSLQKMLELSMEMALQSIENFVTKDMVANEELISQDAKIREQFAQLRNELVERMENNHTEIAQCVDYLMIARSVERLGAHAINITKWIRYMVTGEFTKK